MSQKTPPIKTDIWIPIVYYLHLISVHSIGLSCTEIFYKQNKC